VDDPIGRLDVLTLDGGGANHDDVTFDGDIERLATGGGNDCPAMPIAAARG
jgi:hypothetical protein